MTSLAGKIACAIAVAGSFSIAALVPAPGYAGVIHPPFTAAGNSDVERVRCERKLSNLWSCNDEVKTTRSRRDVRGRDAYASHPCDHASQTAKDGSRCGNRAADKKPGGR